MESIILGGGCFWCLEAVYVQVKGVLSVENGYSGGNYARPTYEQVCSGTTGHAEVVKVTFDPTIITLDTILDIFWIIHDPTTLNQQGADIGTQYRSAIYYSKQQEASVIASVQNAIQLWGNNITTELRIAPDFYKAEAYHQNYFANNPEKAYCQVVINPKLQKFRKTFPTLLKDS
jgi:peptide-methionine (S)-S-oxide reductase